MTTEDRVQDALAAHLEQQELGGPAPDVSHLTDAERERLRGLIALLEQTEGVAFGRGLNERRADVTASTQAGVRLLSVLRDSLPAAARIANDPASGIPGVPVAEGWIVGTFGGRVRVWLVDALEASDAWLPDLGRFFRLFPDTAALAIVDAGLSCLLVQPEDCAPAIEVPRGALAARRYRRPVHEVGEALATFLRELTPDWEPVHAIADQTARPIDVPPIATEHAARAIQEQVVAGGRARRTNPKRRALTELGDAHASGLASLAIAVHEGRLSPDDVEGELRRLAGER